VSRKGRYSTSLGERLAADYEAALDDGTLTDLAEPLSLLNLVVQKCAERVRECDSPEFRARAREYAAKVRVAFDDGEFEAEEKALLELEALLNFGLAEDLALKRLAEETERFAKRLERGWKLHLSRAQSMNEQDVRIVLMRVAETIREVAPPEIAAAISARIDAVFAETLPVSQYSRLHPPRPQAPTSGAEADAGDEDEDDGDDVRESP